MTSPEDRIKELARKSAIDPKAAERLLAAVRPKPVDGGFNPFASWSGSRLTLLGLVGLVVWIASSRIGLHGDGALDVNTSAARVPIGTALVDQVLNYPVVTALLWAVARLFAPKVRPIDMLATVGVARLPVVVASLPLALIEFGAPHQGEPTLLGLAAIAFGLAGWGAQIWLIILGYRTATGLRGGRLAVAVFTSLLAAEVVTKLALHFLNL